MSSFFNRLRNGSSAVPLERPQITRSQSTDSNRFSSGNIRKSYVEENSSSSDSNMRTSSSTSALAQKFQQHDAPSSSSNNKNNDRRSSRSRKPLVVHYAPSPTLAMRRSSSSKSDDVTPLTASALAPLDDPIRMTVKPVANNRRFSRAHTADANDTSGETDVFDAESAMTGFLSSFSPTAQRASSRSRRHRRPPQTSIAASPASTLSSSGYQSPVASSRTPSTSSAALPERESYRHRSSTRHRLSVSFTNHAQRQAQNKAKKYDVEWRGDHESPCCQVCFAMFTKLSRRRHHCRVCGDLVCGDCSQDQVMLQGRFEAPKRACVACVTLLQVMLHHGDPRVSIEGSNAKQTRLDVAKDQQQPLATPRYHDRLGEVHRVMAAGKKSERRGSTLSEMYVISSKWLRSWIAFTRTDPGESDGLASSQHVSTPTNQSGSGSGLTPSPPGPIDNLPLLELSKGKLVKRPELVRDDNVGEKGGDGEGDYQLISAEVWEVFQRIYGGGPAIRVISDDNFRDWIVDAYALLTSAAASVRIAPTVENVLMSRHEAPNTMMRASFISTEKAALISSGGYESVNVSAQSGGPRGSSHMSMSGSSSSESLKDLEKSSSGNNAMADRASRVSMHQARVRPNSPKFSNSRTSERYGMRASMVQHSSSNATMASSVDVRSSSANHTDTGESDAPKAATAASAFAIAMKQARLNAQKAIDARNQNAAP
uniref:FYVE-type domain-containing protein n=1 Tax=Globisporangium ultimum (strain ATCC 200006 / CBS 805.95 / DAOM BR144) TaxID=431595 RepID=K3X9G4_GLOUD